jgi:protein TonB
MAPPHASRAVAVSDQPPDSLPPGEDFAPREPEESPLAWRPPWLRETPAPDELEIRGPSEERAEVLRALLESPQEQARSRKFLSAAAPFLWMVLLGATVTAGIGVVARTSVPATVLGWLPAVPLQETSEPAVASQGDTTAAGAVTAPSQELQAEPVGEDAEGESARVPSLVSSSRDDGEVEPAPTRSGQASGGVDIRTSAPGVWVEIEGVAQGRAPLRVSKLAAGPYVLRVTRPEGSVAQTIYVVGGEITRIHVPGVQKGSSAKVGTILATASEPMPETSSFSAMPSSRIELPVFVLDDPPVIPTGDTEPGGRAANEERASPPEAVNERLPPIPAPFPRPDGARIVLDLTIDASGRVQNINVRRSDDHSVNATVVSAARQWRYRPATRNGVAVPSVRTVDIPLSVK